MIDSATEKAIQFKISNLIDGSRIYPRGFIAYKLSNAQPEATPIEASSSVKVISATVQTSTEVIGGKMVPHPEVEELYYAVLNNPLLLKEFNIREKIIRLAKGIFTKNPGNWVALQVLSPAFTTLHFDFIKDIIAFAQTGRTALNNHTWRSLLKGEVTPRKLEQRSDPKVVLAYIQETNLLTTDTALLTNILKHTSGFMQLLTFLHILVGNTETAEDGISAANANFIRIGRMI
jgi:hypothetical protein